MNSPKTILTEGIDNIQNKFIVGSKDFIEMVKELNKKFVYRCQSVDKRKNKIIGFFLYILQDGFCVCTKTYSNSNYEKLCSIQKEVEKAGFTDLVDYQESKSYGSFDNEDDYFNFLEGGFEENYNDYSKAKQGNFEYYDDYLEANSMGINLFKDYESFKNSDFYSDHNLTYNTSKHFEVNRSLFQIFQDANNLGFGSIEGYIIAKLFKINKPGELKSFLGSEFYNEEKIREYNYNREKIWNNPEYFEDESKWNWRFKDYVHDNQEAYLEYKDAIQKGFKNKQDYMKALELGFEKSSDFQEFKESGCKTREEFIFLKKVPAKIIKMEDKIKDILKDSEEAFNSGRYEEFIRIKFLSIEKIAELLYLQTFKKELDSEKDIIVDEIIDQIEKNKKIEIVDHEELKYWRRIRNKIVHEHLKVEKEKSEKGREFFDEIFRNLNKILDEFKNPK